MEKIEFEVKTKGVLISGYPYVGVVREIRDILERRLKRAYDANRDGLHIQVGLEDGKEVCKFWLEEIE